jgi:hypothetical protein
MKSKLYLEDAGWLDRVPGAVRPLSPGTKNQVKEVLLSQHELVTCPLVNTVSLHI